MALSNTLNALNEQHKYNNLELLAKQAVEGFIIGLHKSPFHGFSAEFAEHRSYNPGDPIKNIDWKVYSRTDKLFIKNYEEETNLRCQIVVDTSSSMYYPEADDSTNEKQVNKIFFSALSASAIMHMLKQQRDAFGLSTFDNEVQIHTKTKSTTAHHKLLLSYLEKAINAPERNKNTSAAKALHQIADSISRRSLVIIFSDMIDNTNNANDMFEALQHLKYNKHEVILFHVVDKQKEMDFEFENRPYVFVDMESGEKVKLHSNKVKDEYVKQMAAFKSELKLKALQYKIDFVEADINKNYHQILQPYLVKRQRMM